MQITAKYSLIFLILIITTRSQVQEAFETSKPDGKLSIKRLEEQRVRQEMNELITKQKLLMDDKVKSNKEKQAEFKFLNDKLNDRRKTLDTMMKEEVLSKLPENKREAPNDEFHAMIKSQTDQLDRTVEGFKTKNMFSSRTEIQKETINQMIEEYYELEKNVIKYRNDDHREFKRSLDEKAPEKRAEFLKAYHETRKTNHQLERENFKKAVDIKRQIINMLSDREL